MSENIKMFSALSVALHLTYSVTFSKVWCILGNPYGRFHWLTQFMLDYVFPRNSMDFIEWMLCYPEIPSRQGVSHKFHGFHWVTLFIFSLRFSQTSCFQEFHGLYWVTHFMLSPSSLRKEVSQESQRFHWVTQFMLSPRSSAYLLQMRPRRPSISALSSFTFPSHCLRVWASWSIHTHFFTDKKKLVNYFSVSCVYY